MMPRLPIYRLMSLGNHSSLFLIWDTSVQSIFIGGVLTLIQEVSLLQKEYGYRQISLCIVGDNAVCSEHLTAQEIFKAYPFLRLLSMYDVSLSYMSLGTYREASSWAKQHDYEVWPKQSHIAYEMYGNTLYIQSYFKKHHKITWASISKKYKEKAMRYFRQNCQGKYPITLHIKNTIGGRHCSNADQAVWYSFLKMCEEKYLDCVFVLVSEDHVDQNIVRLSNVLRVPDYPDKLIQDLALVHQSAAFMGMASGPANMAIFSDIPYCVFKDKGQHVHEMKRELGENDKYIFGYEYQNIYRVDHELHNLIDAFVHMYPQIQKNMHYLDL